MAGYSRVAADVALALWLLSLALPSMAMVFDPANGHITLYGIQVLGAGFVHIAAGQLSWLSNIAFVAVLVSLLRKEANARVLRWSAVALILLSLHSLELLFRQRYYGYPRFLVGYYFWLAAHLGLGVFALMRTGSRPFAPIPDGK